MGGLQIWLPLMLFSVVTECVESNPLLVFLLLSYYEILYHKFIFVTLPFFSLSSDTLDSLLEHFVIVIDRCEHFSFSIQVAFLEVWKCDLSLFFLLNFANILFISSF